MNTFKLKKGKHILDTEYLFGNRNGLDSIFWIIEPNLLSWCRDNKLEFTINSDDIFNQYNDRVTHYFVEDVSIDSLFKGFFYDFDDSFFPILIIDSNELAIYYRMVFE